MRQASMAEFSSSERPVEPSERRIEEARLLGQVAVSRELLVGMAFAVAVLVLAVGGRVGSGGLVAYLRRASVGAVSLDSPLTSLRMGIEALLLCLWLPIGVVWLATLVVGLVQTRGNLAVKPLRADARRLLPRMGRVSVAEHVLGAVVDVCRAGILCVVVVGTLLPCLRVLPALSGGRAATILFALGSTALRLGIGLAVTLVGMGVVDFVWQSVRSRRKLRMSWFEARREHREEEGVPEQKAERQRLHRLLLPAGDGKRASRADLILVESGVAAVALSYAGEGMEAPLVLARGSGRVARRIEKAARMSGISVLESPGLARALLCVEVGETIPESLYEQVAEALVQARRMFS